MWWEWNFISVVSLLKIHNPSPTMRKTNKSQLGDILQNTWPLLFKTFKVIKNEESLRNCHRQEEPKVTRQLNITPQQSPTFLAPGTNFMEDSFPMDWLGRMVSGWFKHITFIVHLISIIITLWWNIYKTNHNAESAGALSLFSSN